MARIDYTARDWSALDEALRVYIQNRFPDWTDFNASNAGNVLKELLQYVGDSLHYYLDEQANECTLDSAEDMENVLALCRQLDYEPRGYTAATGTVTVTLTVPAKAAVSIPARTRVYTEDPVLPLVFEFQTSCDIPAGQRIGTVAVKHARTREILATTDGTPHQAIILPIAPVLIDSVQVRIEGVPWTRAEDLLGATAITEAFRVVRHADHTARVEFGDGVNGAMPVGAAQVVYETGGGRAGNVPASTITRVDGVFTDSQHNAITLVVTNTEACTGGDDPEPLYRTRILAPRARRGGHRSVTRQDFEAHAEEVEGVARALALTSDQEPALEENLTQVHIVPAGGGTPSDTLQEQVLAYLTNARPPTTTHVVQVQAASYLTVNVTATVRIKPYFAADDVVAAVTQALETMFDYARVDEMGQYVVDFGKPIYLSEIIGTMQAVPGVRGVLLTAPAADVEPSANQIPTLGTVTLQAVV